MNERRGFRIRWRRYRTRQGAQVFQQELDALPRDARAAVLDCMARRLTGELLPREQEHIAGDIWALRTSFDGSEYRVYFSSEGNVGEILLAIHAFRKKSQRIPAPVLERVRKRLADWRSWHTPGGGSSSEHR